MKNVLLECFAGMFCWNVLLEGVHGPVLNFCLGALKIVYYAVFSYGSINARPGLRLPVASTHELQ